MKNNNPGRAFAGATYARAMLWSQAGRIGETVLSLALTLLVVRWVNRTDYSNYTTTSSLIFMLLLFTTLGLTETLTRNLPLIRAENPGGVYQVFRVFLLARIMIVALTSGLIWFGRELLAEWLNFPFLQQEIGWILLYYWLYNLVELTYGFFSGMLEIKWLSLSRLLGQATNLVFLAILTLAGIISGYWLIISLVISQLVSMLVFIVFHGKSVVSTLNLPHSSPEISSPILGASELKKPGLSPAEVSLYIPFARDMWITSILNVAFLGQLDVLILAAAGGEITEVPLYTLGLLLSSRVQSLLTGWTNSHPAIMATIHLQEGVGGLQKVYPGYYQLNLRLYFLPMVALAVVAAPLVAVLLGNSYLAVGLVLQIFCVQHILQALLGSPLGMPIINALNKQNISVRWRGALFILDIGLGLWLSPWLGAVGAALAALGVNVALALVEAWLLRTLLASVDWLQTLKLFACALIAAGSSLWLIPAGTDWITLILRGTLLSLVLLAGAMALGVLNLSNLRKLLSRSTNRPPSTEPDPTEAR